MDAPPQDTTTYAQESAGRNGHRTLAEHLLWHLDEGWQIITLPPGSKKPNGKDWPNHPISRTLAAAVVDGSRNIGTLTGAVSGGLYDVDLDHPWAVQLGPRWLPKTDRIHGRASAPRRHYWYQDPTTPDRATVQFTFQPQGSRRATTYCELRGGHDDSASQTVIPPSTYPKTAQHAAERCVWAADGAVGQVT